MNEKSFYCSNCSAIRTGRIISNGDPHDHCQNGRGYWVEISNHPAPKMVVDFQAIRESLTAEPMEMGRRLVMAQQMIGELTRLISDVYDAINHEYHPAFRGELYDAQDLDLLSRMEQALGKKETES